MTRLAAVLLCVAGLFVPIAAQSEPNPGLAVVDFATVRREAAAAKSIAAQVEAFVADYQQDIEREEASLRIAQEQLKVRREELSEEAYADERRKWETNVANAQRRFLERRQQLDRARTLAWQRVNDMVSTVIQDMAAERKLVIVLRRDQAVYVASGLEITEEVLLRLNARLPAIKIDLSDG